MPIRRRLSLYISLLMLLSFFFICPQAAQASHEAAAEQLDKLGGTEEGVLTGVHNQPGAFVFERAQGLSFALYAEEDDDYDIRLYYPVTSSSPINELLRDFAVSEAAGFKERRGSGTLEMRFRHYTYNQHLLSFALDISESWEQGGQKRVAAFAFDLIGACRLELSALLGQDYDLDGLIASGAERAGANADDFGGFAFDAANLYLYFNTGEAAAEQSVPLWELGDHWNADAYCADYYSSDEQPDGSVWNADAEYANGAEEAYYPVDASNPPPSDAFGLPGSHLTGDGVPVLDGRKYVALTFDDGPDPECTMRLLDALERHGAKATFFVLGHRVEAAADIILRMYQDGHSVGNHSYNHKQLTAVSSSQLDYQVNETNRLIEGVTGVPVTLLRPPYGSRNTKVIGLVESVGMSIITWDIDPKDWLYFDPRGIADHVAERAQDGSIILLHDVYQTSVDAAILILEELTERGFVFVTVDELISMNSGLSPGLVYRNGKSR